MAVYERILLITLYERGKGPQKVNSVSANKTEMGAFLSQDEKADIKHLQGIFFK